MNYLMKFALPVLCLMAAGSVARATALRSIRADALVGVDNPDNWPNPLTRYCSEGSAGAGSATCGTTYFGMVEGYGVAHASAGYGALHAYAEAWNSGSGAYSPLSGIASASAEFLDTLILFADENAPVAFSGILSVGGALEGSVAQSSQNATAHGGFSIIAAASSGAQNSCYISIDAGHTGPQTCDVRIPVVQGDVVTLWASVGAESTVWFRNDGGSGRADFADTAWITGIQLLDRNGMPNPTATYTSASGTIYGQAPSAVPEPGTVALFGLGMALVSAGWARTLR